MLSFFVPDNKDRVHFISDTHAYHRNICEGVTSWDKSHGNNFRDFDNEFDMTDGLVYNINSTVHEDDYLISLGDWSFGGKDRVKEFRDRIKCKNVAIVLGNHDQHIHKFSELFVWIGHYNEFRFRKVLFCQSHYPMSSWNDMSRGGVMLHGHCHNNLSPEFSKGRIFDVGVDNPNWNFSPVRLSTLYDLAMQIKVEKVDHH